MCCVDINYKGLYASVNHMISDLLIFLIIDDVNVSFLSHASHTPSTHLLPVWALYRQATA